MRKAIVLIVALPAIALGIFALWVIRLFETQHELIDDPAPDEVQTLCLAMSGPPILVSAAPGENQPGHFMTSFHPRGE